MKSDKQQLTQLSLILRGLLAEPTENEDQPFHPGILSSTGDKPDKLSANTLQIPPIKPGLGATALKDHLRKAIAAHVKQYGKQPDAVCVKGCRSFHVARFGFDPMQPLRGKVALITGAAGAIGYGVCRTLLEGGCHLAATDLPGDKLDHFVADLQKMAPGRVLGVAMDVTRPESVAEAFENVIQTWGGVDIVVHNAGIAMVAHLKDLDLEGFRKLEKVNIEGTLITLQQTQRVLVEQGIGGDIVIMSTKNVPCPGAGFGAYSATKAACHQLGRIASMEMAAHGIRVNMVAPDAVFSEGEYKSGLWQEVGPGRMKARGLDEKGLQEYYRNRNLLKARVTGRHVANAVLFFVTRQTPTTGATIPVDGGLPDATPR